jgi:cobalt-zinc-cadmium efflux system outer membrane protein
MKVIFLMFVCISASSYASQECEKLETPNDLLKCIVSNHAIVQVGKTQVNAIALGVDVASQRPNPEFEFEATDNIGTGYNAEITFLHTFELGGKRSARVKVAEHERDLARVDLLNRQERLSVQTVLDLYRLRQINHKFGILDEIISTFQKITKQYKRAGQLSPEEKMSVSVFSMALEENKFIKDSLFYERQEIIARIESGLGHKLALRKELLPKVKKEWPLISIGELSGAQILKAKTELKLTNAAFNLEKSESWPNLSVGPKIEIEKSGTTQMRYGVALSIPLPLYQTNRGGREKSLAEVQRNQIQLKYTKTRLERQKKYLFQVYKKVSSRIAKTLSNKQVSLRHKNLHKMIRRGVVSATLVIELHRQIMNYYEKLHEQELKGIHALWKIAALEGRILKEELK